MVGISRERLAMRARAYAVVCLVPGWMLALGCAEGGATTPPAGSVPVLATDGTVVDTGAAGNAGGAGNGMVSDVSGMNDTGGGVGVDMTGTGMGGIAGDNGGGGAQTGNGGGAGGVADPSRNQVQAGAVCDRLAQIQCEGEANCCSDPGRDQAACETATAAQCKTEAYIDAISLDAKSGFNPDAAATALTQIEALAMACDPSVAEFATSAAGLMGIFGGSVEAGGSCRPSSTVEERAAASLASCQNLPTTACLPSPDNILIWTCEPRSAAGGPCFTDLNCQDGMYCPNPELELDTFSCALRKAVGEACTVPNECASFFCEAGACVAPSADAAYCLK